MTPTARHRTVEAHFRSLVEEAGVGPPDRVEYQARAVVFLWDGPQVAVVVDFDDVPADQPVRRPLPGLARRPA
jgi:hypothetical protein